MLQEQVTRFLQTASLSSPKLFRENYLEGIEYCEGTACATFILPTPISLDELMCEVEDIEQMISLFLYKPTIYTDYGQCFCAYAFPADEMMFKLNTITDSDGNCDTVYITFYESLEEMYADLLGDIERLSHKSGYRQLRKLNDFLSDFVK
jgi:hypothetical protein